MSKHSLINLPPPHLPTGYMASTVLVVGLACGPWVLAQPVPTPAPPPAEATAPIQNVTVVGNGDGRQAALTSKVVIRRADIERYGDTNLFDVLGRVPGLTVDRSSSKGTEIRMRGLGRGYTQILLNGEPVASGFSLDSLSPNLIERIEVIRVPTADVNNQAIAGAINIITKAATPVVRRESKIIAAHENGGPSLRANGQASGEVNPSLSYLVGGSLAREYFRRPANIVDTGHEGISQTLGQDTERRSDNRTDSVSVLTNLKLKLPQQDSASLDLMLNSRHTDGSSLDRTQTVVGDFPDYSSSETDYRVNDTTFRGNVKWLHHLADEAKFDLDLGLKYGRRTSSARFDGFDEQRQLVLVRNVNAAAKDIDLTINGKYSAKVTGTHSLVGGWQGSFGTRDESRVQQDRTPTGRIPVNLDERYDAKVNRLALFIQDEWAPQERWNTYLGLRYEGLETNTSGNVLERVVNRSGVFSPIVQTVWGIPGIKSDQLRLAVSRTYKAPQTLELIPRRFLSSNNSPANPDIQGNPDLRPELSQGLDVTWERALPGGTLFSVNGFVRRINNVILQELSNVNGNWVSRPLNKGRARVQGIGLEMRFSLNKLAPNLPPVDLRFNLDRNWSRVNAVPGPDNRLDRQQPFSAGIGADYRVATLPLSVGGNFSFQGARQVRLSDTQSTSTGPRRVFDLYSLWKINSGTQLRTTFSNILHQDNRATASYFEAGSTLDRTTQTPTFSAVRLTLESKF